MNNVLQKYTFGFDFRALILFFVIMIPNLIWSFVPAPNDILRNNVDVSIFGLSVDLLSSVFRILMVAALCFIKNRNCGKIKITFWIAAVFISVFLYFIGWALYYMGWVKIFVVLILTISPCLAFFAYAVDRKNTIAALPCGLFTVFHFIYYIGNL